jgi:hypothetical protein
MLALISLPEHNSLPYKITPLLRYLALEMLPFPVKLPHFQPTPEHSQPLIFADQFSPVIQTRSFNRFVMEPELLTGLDRH